MRWWKSWKKKHWDLEYRDGFVTPNANFFPSTYTPRFRRIVEKLFQQCEENPLGALGVLSAFLAALVGLIALLR